MQPPRDPSMVLHMKQTLMSGSPGLLGDRPSGTWCFEEDHRVWAQFQILLCTRYACHLVAQSLPGKTQKTSVASHGWVCMPSTVSHTSDSTYEVLGRHFQDKHREHGRLAASVLSVWWLPSENSCYVDALITRSAAQPCHSILRVPPAIPSSLPASSIS